MAFFKQIDRETGRLITIIGYDFDNPVDDHPTIRLEPITSQEDYDAAVAELMARAAEEESEEENG